VDKSDHNWMVNTITSPECGRAKFELLRACPLDTRLVAYGYGELDEVSLAYAITVRNHRLSQRSWRFMPAPKVILLANSFHRANDAR
jgi:hypothetical protein